MQISRFNKISATDTFLHRLDGRIKTIIFMSGIIIATLLTNWYLVAGLWIISIILFSTLHTPWKDLIVRLLMPFGIAWLVFLNIIFTNGSHPLFILHVQKISLIAYVEGLKLGILIFLRIMAAVTIACILSFSTPMIEILETFRICKVPSIVIDIAGMMYRYVFIILETAHTMHNAQISRMGDNTSWVQRTIDTGKLSGYVIIKSLDHSIKIYNAMLSRGYNEDTTNIEYFEGNVPKKDKNIGIIVLVLLVFVVIINIVI